MHPLEKKTEGKLCKNPSQKREGFIAKVPKINEYNLETINEVERQSIVILGAVFGGGHILYPG